MAASRDDETLMAAVAAHEEGAFRELVERWEGRLRGFFLRSLGSPEDARDLTQETFLRLYRAASVYQAQGRFRPYLFRIAGNLARNRMRLRAARRFVSLDWSSGPGHGEEAGLDLPAPEGDRPDVQHERRAAALRVRRAVLALPERQRVALVLKRWEGMSQEETAQAMGLSVGAVESLLVRALAGVRQDLGKRRL